MQNVTSIISVTGVLIVYFCNHIMIHQLQITFDHFLDNTEISKIQKNNNEQI